VAPTASRFAGEVPEIDAAVVFYGTQPDANIMSKIKALFWASTAKTMLA